MEIKKSTVKQVQSNGTWDGKFGTMYKYEIHMTNGDIGEYMSKSNNQDKFKQGAVVSYEFHAGDFPKIKPHFEQGFNKPNNNTQSNDSETQLQIIRQSSIRTAAEFCRGNCTVDELIVNAEIIYEWCRTGKK